MKKNVYGENVQTRIPKDLKKEMQAYCKKKSKLETLFYSVSKFIKEAIQEKLQREKNKT